MPGLRWGITNSNRAMTIDDVQIESVVANFLIPMINRYNDLEGLDWRGRFTEAADEQLMEFEILNQDRLDPAGQHEFSRFMETNRGTYQEFPLRWGKGVGFDVTFIKRATQQKMIDKFAEGFERDRRRIRFELLKEALNPQSAGRGFWNKTFDTKSRIFAPPNFGVNSFAGSHMHYNTTGSATLTDLDIFADGKQHIREHGTTDGDFICIMNSADITQIEKLAGWVGSTNKANIANSFTDNQFANGVQGEFRYMGITFITEDYMPAGYFLIMGATGRQKPFKFHEPNNTQFRGLLWEPGQNSNFPWQDSYVSREFAVRTFHRWQGTVYQISANADYTAPSDYTGT